MPRRAFLADLHAVQTSSLARGIHHVELGDEDGTITFGFDPIGDGDNTIAISALVPDLSEYPTLHDYLLYTISDDAPACVNAALADSTSFSGHNLPSMLIKLSRVLDYAIAPSSEHFSAGDDYPELQTEVSDEEGGPNPFDDAFSDDDQGSEGSQDQANIQFTDHKFLARVRSDIRAIKHAGFRISYYGDLYTRSTCYLLLSCRVAKLRIAEDALKAWQLDPKMYFILVIRYLKGYQVLEDLIRDPSNSKGSIELRVGTSKKCKISVRAAREAFERIARETESRAPMSAELDQAIAPAISKDNLLGLFIARPLEEMLNARLLDLIKYRTSMAIPWNGAELYFLEKQGQQINDLPIDPKYLAKETVRHASSLPTLMTADHLAEAFEAHSFPLIAMQFALRHLVRCTEFCLVCHSKIDSAFEALRPYVCDSPLCLYQYMSLGFGPSIEHEVLTQPYVVDMLVSLCYASASQEGIRNLPVGLALQVPSIPRLYGYVTPPPPNPTPSSIALPSLTAATAIRVPKLKGIFNNVTSELALTDIGSQKRIRLGDWVSLKCYESVLPSLEHRMVTQNFPVLRLGAPLPVFTRSSSSTTTTASSVRLVAPRARVGTTKVDLLPYNINFDDLDDKSKHAAMVLLLDTLPPILEMRAYLQSQPAGQVSLQKWTDRLTPAALGLLRWIIASNRSCLIQVDSLDANTPSNDRVLGMSNYMQFRFAQGAPSKERRFLRAVYATRQRLSLRFPTMFAWHGSQLRNWHGIIREGLNFDTLANGRAFGDGVYLSTLATLSHGYSISPARVTVAGSPDQESGRLWQQSIIQATHALCLNEVVNAPNEFVSRHPHLVISQLDWIQTRYLFVNCGGKTPSNDIQIPICEALQQDPLMTAFGMHNTEIVIPTSAISNYRRPPFISLHKGNKRLKASSSKIVEVDEYLSDDSDVDEMNIFSKSLAASTLIPMPDHDDSTTAFVPGSLNVEGLSLMAEPSYATSQATRTLQVMLNQAMKLQQSEPLHTLGWHISPNFDTTYQWIVELHSFDLELPLAQDMQAYQVSSIVLEFRFGKDFPYSPPFVRVIRPRFRTLADGGGGHVTTGGAICMELLTNTGWNPASSIEAILLQIRMAITSTDPPARLASGRDYPISGAIAAFRRACLAHGWIVPEDFELMSMEILTTT